MKVVVIGAGAAGVTAAAEIRKREREAEIIIIDKGKNYPYSPCSLPYLISDEIKKNAITTFDRDFFERNKIELKLETEVKQIDRENKKIETSKGDFDYDYLVIATGSETFVPPVKGLDHVDYHKLKTVEDAERIMSKIDTVEKAVIVGGGVIGMELAGSFKKRGINVTVIEATESVLGSILDKRMAKIATKNLGINIMTGTLAKSVTNKKVITNKGEIPYDILITVCGVRPHYKLAEQAGLETDRGIKVNDYMQTSDENIYACGDCVYEKDVAWLGTNAVLQAQIAAQNITGEKAKIRKLHNTTITHIGNISIASTGKTESQLDNSISATYRGESRADYCPEGKDLIVKLIAKDGKIAGAQIIGEESVVGRINWIALAVQNQMEVEKLANAESAYNPMTSPLFDPVVVAAQILKRKIERNG